MLLQISSGHGPAECELAVGKFLEFLKKEEAFEIIQCVKGNYENTFQSVLISGNESLKKWEGSVKWICKSPFRSNHKRKNWFIDISICREKEKITFDESLVRFETFRSSGKGGQNVNKVETGVRAVFVPTGLSVVSTTARSQHMNKKIALDRLCNIIVDLNMENELKQQQYRWLEHSRIERGNAIAVFVEMEFKRKK